MIPALLSDFLDPEEKKLRILKNLIPGRVLRLTFNFPIAPRLKWAILVCRTPLLFLLINSDINDYARNNPDLRSGQLPITKKEYGFLTKPISYINCCKVHKKGENDIIQEISSNMKIIEKCFKIKRETIADICSMVQNTRTLEPIYKNMILTTFKELTPD